MPSASIEEYGVGVVCALPKEMLAAKAMLDDGHEILRTNEVGDSNNYVVGHAQGHKVVIACLPAGVYGTVAAATVAANMLRTFRGIRIGLMIGIGGGIPEPTDDGRIRLGDVVVSQPSDTHGGVIQHDQGKDIGRGRFILKGFLNRPPSVLLTALSTLKAQPKTTRRHLRENISSMTQRAAEEDDGYEFPGLDRDVLFCARCDRSEWTLWDWLARILVFWLYPFWLCQMCRGQKIPRSTKHAATEVHYGIIASGNVLLKNRSERDRLRAEFGAKCIEMEAAGLMNDFPCLVIRGICDYADSHKNDDWQKYAAITAAAFAKLLLSTLSPAQVYEVPYANDVVDPIYLIPMKRKVKNFFGRQDELCKIATYFNQARKSSKSRILVLHAMGGQGKTQIALEYCDSARGIYKGIFWVNSNSILAMTQSMVNIAQQFNPSESMRLPDDEARVKFAIEMLEKWKYRWLLVFDNCDDASIFSELQDRFIPYIGQGSILFTTRHRGLEELGDVIDVPSMPHQAGIQLLLQRYRDVNVNDYLAEGAVIVDRLGNLPLAIDQASSYMQYNHLPIDKLSTFLPKYDAQRDIVLQHTTPDFWRYTRIDDSTERETAISAFTTWELTFQQLLNDEPNRDYIAHFLTLTAFFGQPPVYESIFKSYWELSEPRPTWMSIFTIHSLESAEEEGLGQLQDGFTTQAEKGIGSYRALEQEQSNAAATSWKPDHFWHLLYEASQLSLLDNISPAQKVIGASLTLHPLIRDWLQLRIALGERQEYIREAIDVLNSSIQVCTTRSTDAKIKSAILLHLDAVLFSDNEFFHDGHRLGQEISTCDDADLIALFYRDQGQWSASLSLFHREVTTRKKAMGIEHPSTLHSMSGLALVLRYQGKYNEAEQMHRQVLEARKRVLGDEHPDTLMSVNSVALTLSDQGIYDAAAQMHRQVLEITQRKLGVEHPQVLMNMHDLAEVLRHQGKYDVAEQILRELVAIQERVFGPECRETLISMNTLARALNDQGKYNDAELILRQVLQVRKRVLGDEHPDTSTGINALASALKCQGKYSEAVRMYREVLEVRERRQGNEHPDTLTSITNVASVLHLQGKYDEAEQLNRHALKVTERVLGEKHPDTLINLNDLGLVLRDQGKYSEAEQLHRRELQERERTLGDGHLITQASMNNLALVLRRQGKNSEAEQMYRRALAARAPGDEHPSTLRFMSNLAIVLRHQSKYSEAEQINRQILSVRERTLGVENSDTLTSMNNLALVLGDQGKFIEEEQIHRRVLEATRKMHGDKHPDTLDSMNSLGLALCEQDKYDEAEDLQLRAFQASFTIYGGQHPKSKECLTLLRHTLECEGSEGSRARGALLEKWVSLDSTTATDEERNNDPLVST